MTAVLTIIYYIIPILAGGAALAGVYFLFCAFTYKATETRAVYNVGRQKARHDRQVDLVRSVFSFMVALILVGVFGLSPLPIKSVVDNVTTPTPEPTTAVPTVPLVPSPTATTVIVLPTATAAPLIQNSPTPVPTIEPSPITPADTPTPPPRTATVSSGVGVWLRAEPTTNAEQLAWLLQGAIVIVLPETAAVENLAWQQVQTQEGLVGWVAVPFITYNE